MAEELTTPKHEGPLLAGETGDGPPEEVPGKGER